MEIRVDSVIGENIKRLERSRFYEAARRISDEKQRRQNRFVRSSESRRERSLNRVVENRRSVFLERRIRDDEKESRRLVRFVRGTRDERENRRDAYSTRSVRNRIRSRVTNGNNDRQRVAEAVRTFAVRDSREEETLTSRKQTRNNERHYQREVCTRKINLKFAPTL